jgi:hypothetical protein
MPLYPMEAADMPMLGIPMLGIPIPIIPGPIILPVIPGIPLIGGTPFIGGRPRFDPPICIPEPIIPLVGGKLPIGILPIGGAIEP